MCVTGLVFTYNESNSYSLCIRQKHIKFRAHLLYLDKLEISIYFIMQVGCHQLAYYVTSMLYIFLYYYICTFVVLFFVW